MNLVLVESPTKARTLARFLGDGFNVQATYGHVRDLPERRVGVKIVPESKRAGEQEYRFEPEYVVTKKQAERIKEIKTLSDAAAVAYLATDPDREGEAIAWHVAELLQSKRAGELESRSKFKRIVFHEITKPAIMEALAHPREIDMQLVSAQQARRILDRLVGYKLSPVLWKKVRRGLSAGRVQSVALRLIVEREREIEKFTPVEYWDIQVVLKKLIVDPSISSGLRSGQLTVKLVEVNGGKMEIHNGEAAKKAEEALRGAKYEVAGVERKEFSRTPPAPFTTSTLQQTAANRLGWSAKKTMQVAQGLYEEGLITYHRTDSTNIADVATAAARDYIRTQYGQDYALGEPRVYKIKSKVAQEAHEAIRPTDVGQFSNSNFQFSNKDQGRLYELIWKRFVACQMAEARGESVKITVNSLSLSGDKYGLEAKGETIAFDGWYKVSGKDLEESLLPEMNEGEKLEIVDLTAEQKFTQPPARYNDASLIKTLEEMEIGRPSTYAPIITTIQDRQYVERLEKRFKPTSLGLAVNDFLVANFPEELEYGFTARMEDGLDDIANGEKEWMPYISEFWGPFSAHLEKVEDTAARVKVEVETTGEKCPKCSEGEVVIRLGKFGKFLACSRYPECDYKANFLNKIGMKCPKCTNGEVIMRRTRNGKSFYGCSSYPQCDFASWTKPQTPTQVEGATTPQTT